MKIKFIQSCAGIGIAFAAGQVVNLPPGKCRNLIALGLVVPLETPEEIKPERPLKPIVQEVKKGKSRPQKRNVKANNRADK